MARTSRRDFRDFGEAGFEAEKVAALKEEVRGGGGLVLGNDLDQESCRGGALGAEIVCVSGIGGGISAGLSRSGLPRALDLTDPARSDGRRGDIGTFHKLASSGNSSSESWYSSSSSWIDLRLGCHEPRLEGGGSDDLGEMGLGPIEDALYAADGSKVEGRDFGEVDLFRGPFREEEVDRAGTEELVKPRRSVAAFLGRFSVCGGP